MSDKHFLLFYEAVDNYVERRAPFRAEHVAYARQYEARGELVLGGAFADPVDGSLLLFKSASADAVRRFAESDPYVREGLVRRWHVREWTTVIGDLALNQIAPR